MFKHLKTFEGSIRWYDENGKLGPDEGPEPYMPIPPCINYNRMMDYIDRKYEIKNRDFHENYRGDDFRGLPRGGRREYLDFWHWLLDHCF